MCFRNVNQMFESNSAKAGGCTDRYVPSLFSYEPAHDKTYHKTCATSENKWTCSLIRVFAGHMGHLQPPGYPRRDKRKPLAYCVNVQADLYLYWSHRSYCWLCRALSNFISLVPLTTLVIIVPILRRNESLMRPINRN